VRSSEPIMVNVVDGLYFAVTAPCSKSWPGMRHSEDVRIVLDRAMDHTESHECRRQSAPDLPTREDSLEPSPAEMGDTTTLDPGEWTPLDEIGTQLYVYGDQPVDVAIQYAEVESEVRQLRREVETHERRYLDVQKVLDGAIGGEVEDGAGMGLVADVALLAQRYADLKARVISSGWRAVVDEVESAELAEPNSRPSSSGADR
jgi:hypothetical protein